MDMKLELVGVPVSDTDRAKEFYERIGFVCDMDAKVHEGLRFVQFTPPGSACSIVIGEGTSDMKPGSQRGLQVVVDSAAKAREFLLSKDVEASELDVQPWGTFTYFSDPDGNTWSVQEMPPKPAA
jgi:catechol 2,3-dioxygenase-like lactoylglutathione lyase family enzyme